MWKVFIALYFLMLAITGNVLSFKKRVCIIGAGASGILSARLLAVYPSEFEPIVFEKNSDVGGLWIYTNSTTVDKHGLPVHSSMYRDLRTNGPKEILNYPDFEKIQGENVSFVKHETILQYLRKYADHFNVRQYIQFDTNVEEVKALPEHRWLIIAKDLTTNKIKQLTCDIVMIGNGHAVKGYIPKIPGIENFSGTVIHSHLYRKPEDFINKTVIVLGASYSGWDISIQISSHAKKVYLSSKKPNFRASLPRNIKQVAAVVEATGNELRLSDNTTIKADAFVYCTGYQFNFPFLDANSGIVVENGKYVRPLYKHLINVEHPTMAILNLPYTGLPLLMPYAQVQYYLAVLRGNITLPSREEMLNDLALPPGIPKDKAHQLVRDQVFTYYNDLATEAGSAALPPYFKPAVIAYLPNFFKDPVNYRKKNLYIYDDNHVDFK